MPHTRPAKRLCEADSPKGRFSVLAKLTWHAAALLRDGVGVVTDGRKTSVNEEASFGLFMPRKESKGERRKR